jgi:hypothetical protein
MRRNTTFKGKEAGSREIDRARATDPVADVALIGLVVRHELGGALDVAVVHLVVEEAVDSHHHRLLHLVRHHDPDHRLHLRRGRRLPETKERIVRDRLAGVR